MAGGKETPRQKMIGMMYLVLTAMLALQVSSTLLEKFQLLNNSLEQANSSANGSNEKTVGSMQKAVSDAGNKPEYVALLNQAGEVRKETSEMIKQIDDLKTVVINAGGGIDPQTGVTKNLAEEEKVHQEMVGEGKKGKAYALKAQLESFVAKMQTYMAKDAPKFPTLALDAAQDPMLAKAEAATKAKDFAELNFSTTPVPAALATLSQKQSEVRRLEGEVLDYLASQVGAKEIKFDKIFAVVIPDSRSVVAGQKYKAEVAIGAFSSAITPRISINGTGLQVKEGKGEYKIIAQGGEFDKNGTLKRSYTASVSYPKPGGGIETVEKKEEYTVLKPSVEIETASLPRLYLGCANKLSTISPGLGALYQPTFSGSGGDFIAGGGGKVTIVPSAKDVVLNINNSGILLDSKPFKVRLVPKPTVQVLANGSPMDDKKGAPASAVRIIDVNVISDESFKESNPDDANYRVSEYRITLARGVRPVKTVSYTISRANINELAQLAQPGDRYVIAIQKVQRKNFRGEIKDVDLGEIVRQLPLN